MKKRQKEITYDVAAKVLGCSPRHVRTLIRKHGIAPIRRGYRTVSLPAEKIVNLKLSLLPS